MSNVSLVWVRPPGNKKQKAAAILLTLIFLLLVFLFMAYNQIVQKNMLADIEDDLWARFQPKKVIKHKPAKRKSTEAKKTESVPKITRMNMAVLKQSLARKTETSVLSSTLMSKRQAKASRLTLQTRQTNTPDEHSLNLTSRQNKNAFIVRGPSRRRGSSRSAIGLTTKDEGQSTGMSGERATLGQGGFKVGVSARGTGASGTITVTMQELKELEKEFGEFSSLFKPLAEWMKRHPARFPPILKRFMNYKPGNLTSRVTFSINNRSFDMALLCVEQAYEVRIALMEINRNKVTYLVDQGFREQTNLLRYGKVMYNKLNNTIGQFGTSLKPAKGKRADEFYQVFLSWWNSVKDEVE